MCTRPSGSRWYVRSPRRWGSGYRSELPGHGGFVEVGEGSGGRGPFCVFADLDGDGLVELVAGRTAFADDGSVVWHRDDLVDGVVASSNADCEPLPEIMLFDANNDVRAASAAAYAPRHAGWENEDVTLRGAALPSSKRCAVGGWWWA